MEDYVFRNPADHVEEIHQAYVEFSSLAKLYAEQPREIDKHFLKLLYDLSHIVHHHDFASAFADEVCAFMETHPESLRNDVRLQFVQAVMVLHNREVIDTITAINKLIPLFRLNDKNVRRCIFGHFITKLPFHQTSATKRELHKFVSTDYDSRVAFKTLQLVIDVFHKENTGDVKTINFVARCLSSSDPRVINTVISFFLDPYIPKTDEIDVEEERKKAELRLKVSTKTNARQKKLEKLKRMKVPLPQDPVQVIGFIDDPQKFAIRLFALLSAPENAKVFKGREPQIRANSLLSKVIASAQLDFDQYFNWVARFLRPSYDEITRLLAIVASAVHELTTPETVTELMRTIANRFVVDSLDEEVLIVGMNTIREICAKNPHGMTEELLSDLIAYKKSNVKGVVMAARSLIQLFRDVRPDLLPKKERGKPKEEDQVKEPLQYGETRVAKGVAGAEGVDQLRPITQEEFEKINEGKEIVDDETGEVDEQTILEGSRVRPRTKEEKLEASREGKPEHGFHSHMADKTAGFSNKEKLKNKPFMLTRFRKNAGHVKLRSLNAIQKDKKRRAAILKQKLG